jgi:hypothetical protein
MKKLKKLVLNFESPAELKTRSNALEEIDTTLCHSNTTVVECFCPSLKMITTLYSRGRSSIRPCVPLNDGELDGRIESIQFEGENVASFTAKDRSFMGLAVPPAVLQKKIHIRKREQLKCKHSQIPSSFELLLNRLRYLQSVQ